ncbi:hypothetical protein PoB_003745000 [Plakobranchus ocellatus]|uniref:Uncharacterized protein n=1 Tax=Plakobranchus ocellatus TaxID=259542 RepID=A0AAV4ARN2_9GAST|nr:hypothetical protein PoB_003745000 [Plakobranchus ocellatus]
MGLRQASPLQGDLRLSGPRSGQGAGGGARTRHREYLQITGRVCYALRHQHLPKGGAWFLRTASLLKR